MGLWGSTGVQTQLLVLQGAGPALCILPPLGQQVLSHRGKDCGAAEKNSCEGGNVGAAAPPSPGRSIPGAGAVLGAVKSSLAGCVCTQCLFMGNASLNGIYSPQGFLGW